MAKNDFDLDFDFEKEFGFDSQAGLDSEYTDDDFDLSQFGDDDLGIDLSREADGQDDFDDFDLEGLDLGDLDLSDASDRGPDGFGPDEEDVLETEEALNFDDYDLDGEPEEDPLDAPFTREDYEDEDFGMEAQEDLRFDDEDDDFEEEAELMDFSRRASFFEEEAAPAEETAYAPQEYAEPEYRESAYEEQVPEQEAPVPEEETEPEVREKSRRRREPREAKPPIRLTVPPVFGKIARLYFPTREEINAKLEPAEGQRRRRKPTKAQIFKEFYLPTLIAGLAIVLMLSFVIGTLSNAIDRSMAKREEEERLALEESRQAELVASEAENVLAKAELLAQGYNYQEAIDLIEAFPGEPTQEMTTKRAEYVNAKSHLVDHQDPTLIPNLSFHVLIEDPVRAYADEELGGLYNRNFVTTGEFKKILEQLYVNNFVLVDFDSFVQSNSVDGTSTSYFAVPISLPQGKKPVMITETMVNYFDYMIDSNDDGTADAGGAGFASRLVVDESGEIKAEYVDMNNSTLTGDYDLVPILESFIAEHPDFSYRGARATLAVSGSQGVFGWRINSSSIATKGQDYYNQQVAGATEVVNALKEKGYRIACYTFDNIAYHSINANLIQADLQQWNSQIAPVLGEVDTIVFARESDIGDYSGNKFEVLYQNGFRFMVKNADTPYAEVNNTYIRQSRLMVTGETMAAKATMFTDVGVFDPNVVLDLATRGQVPVG